MGFSSCSKMQRPSKGSPAVTGPRSDSRASMSFCSCIPASPQMSGMPSFRPRHLSICQAAADFSYRPCRDKTTLVDVGTGSGVGGIFAARLLGKAVKLVLADINHKALAFSLVNAALNGLPSTKAVDSDVLGGIDGDADIIIANPPYLVDDDRRLYRHGGGELGIDLAVRIAEESLPRFDRAAGWSSIRVHPLFAVPIPYRLFAALLATLCQRLRL